MGIIRPRPDGGVIIQLVESKGLPRIGFYVSVM